MILRKKKSISIVHQLGIRWSKKQGRLKTLSIGTRHPKGFETLTNYPPAFQRCIALDKPNRNKKKLDRFGFDQDEVKEIQLPIETAIDERDSWISVMTEEMESLYKNSVWELVPKPIASDERDSWISAMTEEIESLYKNSVWELVS